MLIATITTLIIIFAGGGASVIEAWLQDAQGRIEATVEDPAREAEALAHLQGMVDAIADFRVHAVPLRRKTWAAPRVPFSVNSPRDPTTTRSPSIATSVPNWTSSAPSLGTSFASSVQSSPSRTQT